MKKIRILKYKISLGSQSEIIEYITENENNNGYYTFVNSNSLAQAEKNKPLSDSLKDAKMNLPDGYPIVLLAKLKGAKFAERIAGPDFTLKLIKFAERRGKFCVFYGGTTEQIKGRKNRLKLLFPNLKFISLSENEEKRLIKINNSCNIDYLFVSLGCPKQEIWAYNNYKKINSKIFCIGAAMPYILGDERRAPKIIQKIHFEWLYRFIKEPLRTWKKYLINSPKFIILSLKEIFFR